MKDEIDDALCADMGRKGYANDMYEVGVTEEKCNHAIDHLHEWMRSNSVDTPMLCGPASCYTVYEPLGTVLVIGSWNYPIFTTLGPLIYVIASGCCGVIKPSELTPFSSKVMKKLVEKYLDTGAFHCIEG